MELICPSCEARYHVPETSIGEKGRQVSCMNCGHSWHAFPPLILGSSSAPPTTASPGIDFQAPPRPGRSSAAFVPSEPADTSSPTAAPSFAPPTAPAAPGTSSAAASTASSAPITPPSRAPEPARGSESSRSEQLAEIREMLAEVQSEERAAAALTPEDDDRTKPGAKPQPRLNPGAAAMPAAPGAAEAPPRHEPLDLDDTDDDDSNGSDPLRRRMAMHDRSAEKKRTDVERLRRRHDRRARRQNRARDVGSGAFLTGFLLVVMIAAAMTALYILQPQIVARMPGTEQMLADYVNTVDGARISLAEAYQSARVWVLELIEKYA